MKPQGAAKHFILALLLAVVGYAALYRGIEHWRTHKGPWRVAFIQSTDGSPAIVVQQVRLGITNVQLQFVGAARFGTNCGTVVFDQLRGVPYEMPFGQCVFMDTTSLPGTVSLRLFSHDIVLLPRTLTIDGQEHPWQSGEVITLRPGPSGPASEPPARRRS